MTKKKCAAKVASIALLVAMPGLSVSANEFLERVIRNVAADTAEQVVRPALKDSTQRYLIERVRPEPREVIEAKARAKLRMQSACNKTKACKHSTIAR